MPIKYDVVIVGAGPAGIFTALELVNNAPGISPCIYWKRARILRIENAH